MHHVCVWQILDGLRGDRVVGLSTMQRGDVLPPGIDLVYSLPRREVFILCCVSDVHFVCRRNVFYPQIRSFWRLMHPVQRWKIQRDPGGIISDCLHCVQTRDIQCTLTGILSAL